MPDDVPDDGWNDPEPEAEAPEVGHDDIMKRLVDYQRSLREGASPTEAVETLFTERLQTESPTTTGELVDLSSADPTFEVESLPEPADEIEPEPAGPSPSEPVPATLGEEPEPEMAASREEPEPETTEVAHEREPAIEEEPDVGPEPVPGYVTIPANVGGLPAETRTELEERLTALEDRLQRLGSKVGELRRNFQDMAIAADERLASMEDEIGRVAHEGEM